MDAGVVGQLGYAGFGFEAAARLVAGDVTVGSGAEEGEVEAAVGFYQVLEGGALGGEVAVGAFGVQVVDVLGFDVDL